MSASAVSRQIKALEQELQFSLFYRKARSLELTDAGRMLYEQIDPLIRQVDAVTGNFSSRLRAQAMRISVQPLSGTSITVVAGSHPLFCGPATFY